MRELAAITEDPTDEEERVFFLRRGGLEVPQIAREVGISIDDTVRLYNSYRNKMAKHTMDRSEAKELFSARYEGLIHGWYDAAQNGDLDALKAVAPLMRDAIRLHGLDQVDPADANVVQNILVIGQDKKSFIEALRTGRGDVDEDEIMVEEEDVHE